MSHLTWNEFRARHKGTGLTLEQISTKYRQEKGLPSVKKAPIKKAPIKKAPIKKAPIKKAPIKKAPVKKAPRFVYVAWIIDFHDNEFDFVGTFINKESAAKALVSAFRENDKGKMYTVLMDTNDFVSEETHQRFVINKSELRE